MNQMIVVCLLCMVIQAQSLSFGSGSAIYHTNGKGGGDGKHNKKAKISTEFLAELGSVCSKCSKYQSACTKLQELKNEINKLPTEQTTKSSPPPVAASVKSRRKDSKLQEKVAEIDAASESF